jgi:uncharacterized protein
MTQKLQSCLYRGSVQHARHLPHEHRFQYQLFLVYLDLDELDQVFAGRWAWSTKYPTIAWFWRKDHLGDPHVPLAESVRELVHQRTGLIADGPIRLLTNLRYFGYVMNPVSYYYCFDRDGKNLLAVVAEINNTPWGERHCYVLPQGDKNHLGDTGALEFQHDKDFHVSPFMPMGMKYHWRFTTPGDELAVSIGLDKEGLHQFDATLGLRRVPITGWNLTKTLIRFPCMTVNVVAAIYWQALRLWWKKTPFYPHPKTTSKSNTLNRSHNPFVSSDHSHV